MRVTFKGPFLLTFLASSALVILFASFLLGYLVPVLIFALAVVFIERLASGRRPILARGVVVAGLGILVLVGLDYGRFASQPITRALAFSGADAGWRDADLRRGALLEQVPLGTEADAAATALRG